MNILLLSYFCNSVIQLPGPNYDLHLEDITFGHATLNQSLQDFLLVQPKKIEKQGYEGNQALHALWWFWNNFRSIYLKLPVRSDALGLSRV